jgi:hypothetical protein
VHVRVAVPDPCRVVWSSLQVIPEGAEMESVTVPVNPLTALTVMVDVEGEFVVALIGVVLALMVRSGVGASVIVRDIVAEVEDSPAGVPVMVRV